MCAEHAELKEDHQKDLVLMSWFFAGGEYCHVPALALTRLACCTWYMTRCVLRLQVRVLRGITTTS